MSAAVVTCAAQGCVASHNNDRWSRVRAHEAGWFESRRGGSFCPEHVPDWVAGWRAKRKGKVDGG